jgi:cytochrome c oxidase cbb3-type subunit III
MTRAVAVALCGCLAVFLRPAHVNAQRGGAEGRTVGLGRGAQAGEPREVAPNARWWWAWTTVSDPTSVKRGKPLFVTSCGPCHAANATGTPKAPNLIRSTIVRHDKDGSAIASVIKSDVSHMTTPAANLAPEQMRDVVSFIRDLVQTYDKSSSDPMPADYPVTLLLTGNAEAGRAWFDGAGTCSTCHSITGDLAGIAGKYSPVDLQARFMMPRTTKPKTATVTLSSGERVTGVLLAQNTYDVSVRTADGKTQSWPADSVRVDVTDPLQAHRDLLPKYTDADMHNMFAYLWTLK